MGNYQEQIKNAILERIYQMQHLHEKDIKAVIDDIKNQYLWNSKIRLEDLKSAVAYFKKHWHELKEQAKSMRKSSELIGFVSYQV